MTEQLTDRLSHPAEPGPIARHPVLRYWPIAAGLAAAGLQIGLGASREAVAITLTVAALCYLGAAALARPWIAWVGIPAGSVLVVIARVADLPWWIGIAVAAVILVAAGLVLRVPRPALSAQTIALIVSGATAIAALIIAPQIGLLLAGIALTAHAGWDAIHYRRNVVVSRALSTFCMFLDVPLGVAAIVLAITW